MSLTAPARYSNRPGNGNSGQNSYIVKAGQTIYHGALVGIDPNIGLLQNWSSASAANVRFRGIAMPVGTTLAPTSVVGSPTSSPPPECPVNESGIILEGATVAGAKAAGTVGSTPGTPGKPVYATDENTFTMTATSNVGAIGELVRCTTDGVGDVRLFTPQEYLALESLGKV